MQCLDLQFHYCATVSASNPNLQWLPSLDFRKLYPFFGWRSSWSTYVPGMIHARCEYVLVRDCASSVAHNVCMSYVAREC